MKSNKPKHSFTIIIFLLLFLIIFSHIFINNNCNLTNNPFINYSDDNVQVEYIENVYDNLGNLIKCNRLEKNTDINSLYESTSDSTYKDGVNIDLYDDFKKPLNSRYNCLYDADTDCIIYGNNVYDKTANASTTKIMTCIIALENSSPDDKVTCSAYAASMPDVQMNFREGDVFYLKDLLYSLMLESHNDTAVAIAEHVGGSVEGFAKMMNDKAQMLGCKNTHFVTPNGLDDDLHYTCAYDLCKIADYALSDKRFVQIVNTASKSITELTGKKTYTFNNHNSFLNMFDGAIGVKTGYTSKAGYCFVGAVKYNKKIYISCVLACGWSPNKNYKWDDTKKLMEYALEKNITDVTLSKEKMDSITYNVINQITLKKIIGTNINNSDLISYTSNYKPIEVNVTNKNTIRYHVIFPNYINVTKEQNNVKLIIKNDNNVVYKEDIPVTIKPQSHKFRHISKEIFNLFFQI